MSKQSQCLKNRIIDQDPSSQIAIKDAFQSNHRGRVIAGNVHIIYIQEKYRETTTQRAASKESIIIDTPSKNRNKKHVTEALKPRMRHLYKPVNDTIKSLDKLGRAGNPGGSCI